MIRKMNKKDITAVIDIFNQGIIEGTSTFTYERPSEKEWDNEHLKDCRFVYEKDNIVVGFIAISSMSRKKAYWGSVEVSIYVHKDFRGYGIGKKLMNALCSESEKLGYWSLYAIIFDKNKSSISLAEKCGFRIIGYREKVAKDKFGNWQNTILLERRNKNII